MPGPLENLLIRGIEMLRAMRPSLRMGAAIAFIIAGAQLFRVRVKVNGRLPTSVTLKVRTA